MASPEPQGSHQEQKNLQIIGRRIPQPLSNEVLENFKNALGSYARLDAREKAKHDIKIVLQHETDLPSRQIIDADAETVAYQHIKRLTVDAGWIVDDDNDTDQLLKAYLTNFTEVYDKVIAENERAGILHDEATRRICQQARQDKQEHSALNRVLHHEKLRHFATARAMLAFGLDPLLSLDDLDRIERYASSYTSFYNQHDPAKGVGRSSLPGSFSGGTN